MAKRYPTPEPLAVEHFCTVCMQDWSLHPDNPTVMDCIEVLRDLLVKASRVSWNFDWSKTYPLPLNGTDNTTSIVTTYLPRYLEGTG